jgi:hypothetical protein
MVELLKQTLEAFEIAAEGGRVHFHSYAEALRQAIAELESQEPVAYINVEKRILEWAKLTRWETPTVVNLPKIPLYTHPPQRTEQKTSADDFFKMIADSNPKPFPPPQRTWIGLTDDEFNELYDRYVPLTCYALLIEKVEAKLKQKNGYFEEKNT